MVNWTFSQQLVGWSFLCTIIYCVYVFYCWQNPYLKQLSWCIKTTLAICKTHISFNGLFSRTAWVSHHQKGKTILDVNEARDDGVAVSSAGPYTNHLYLTADRQPHQHLITQFLTVWMLFLTPYHSIKVLKGSWLHLTTAEIKKGNLTLASHQHSVNVLMDKSNWNGDLNRDLNHFADSVSDEKIRFETLLFDFRFDLKIWRFD